MILLPTDDNPIRPSSINTDIEPGKDRKFDVFPTLEMNRVAFLVVAMLARVGNWVEFTRAELATFADEHGVPWGDMLSYVQGFEQLLEKTRLDREPLVVEVTTGNFRVTHEFVALCFASAPNRGYVTEFEPSAVHS